MSSWLFNSGLDGTQQAYMEQQTLLWERRYNTLRTLSSERGVMELAEDQHIQAPETFWTKAADFLQRSNFASAGIADYIIGKPKKGQTFGGRVITELLGDTWLGDRLGVKRGQRQRETFGDVLEQSGLPDLTFSQVTGFTLLGWDPGLRGTVGLGLDIMLDPLSYVPVGNVLAKGAAPVITRAGKATRVTKPVADALRARQRKALVEYAEKRHPGLGQEFQEALARGDDARAAEIFEDLSRRRFQEQVEYAASRKMRLEGLKNKEGNLFGQESELRQITQRLETLQHEGFEPLQARLYRDVERRFMGELERGAVAELPGIGLAQATRGARGLGGFGHVLVSNEKMAELGGHAVRTMGKVMNMSKPTRVLWEAAQTTGQELGKVVDTVFHSTNKLMREIQGAVDLKRQYMNKLASKDRMLLAELEDLFGVGTNTNTAAWHLLSKAVDDPGKYLNEWVNSGAVDPERAMEVYDRVNHMMRSVAALDTNTGLVTPKLFERFTGRYMPHLVNVKKADDWEKYADSMAEWRRLRGDDPGDFERPGLGRFGEARHAKTMDEWEEWRQHALGKAREVGDQATVKELEQMALILDPRELIARRVRASLDAYETHRFVSRLQSRYAASVGMYIRGNFDEIFGHGLDEKKAYELVKRSSMRMVSSIYRDKPEKFFQDLDEHMRVWERALGKRREYNKALEAARYDFRQLPKQKQAELGGLAGDVGPKKLIDKELRDSQNAALYFGGFRMDELPQEMIEYISRMMLRHGMESGFTTKAALIQSGGDALPTLGDMIQSVEEMLTHARTQFEKAGRQWHDVLPQDWRRRLEALFEDGWRKDVGPTGQPWRKYTFKLRQGGKSVDMDTWLPEGIAKDLSRWDVKVLERVQDELGIMLRAYDKATNFFKEWVTAPFPSFHFRNAYSNIAQMALRIGVYALNPVEHKRALDILGGKDGTFIAENGIRYTYNQMRQLIEANGIQVDYSKVADLIPALESKRLNKPKLVRWLEAPVHGVPGHEKLGKAGGLLKGGAKIGAQIESEARALTFMFGLKKGMTPENAANLTRQLLFDYQDLSPIERELLRRWIPFYTWTSKNIRLQIRNLYERPGAIAAQAKLLGRDRGPQEDMLPEYRRGELKIRLADGPNGAARYAFNIDLPVNALDILFDKSMERTLLNNITLWNPLLKAPLEIAFNMESFTGREIRGQQFMGNMGPTIKRLDKLLGGFLEHEEVALPDGTIGHKANGTKVYLLFKTFAVSRLLTEQVRFDEMLENKTWVAGLVQGLTGVDFEEFDLTTQQRNTVLNRYRRMEEVLIDDGYLRRNVNPVATEKGLPQNGNQR